MKAAVGADAHAVYRQRIDAFVASRDAGSSVALDALQSGITSSSLDDAAARLSSFVDEAQAIVADEYKPALACRPGCAFCCRKPGVLVTLPEFLRILMRIDAFDPPSRSALASRASDYVTQLGNRSFDAPTDDSVPCPLLVDERCSIYEQRPLVCRGYNSLDAEACRRAHNDGRFGVPIFAPLKDVSDGAAVGTTDALTRLGADGSMLDLGTALHLALSSEATPQMLADDTGPLAPARNTTWAGDLVDAVRNAARDIGIRF